MQVPLVNVSRLRGFTQSISRYFVAESSAPQTETGSGVWVCCACKARPVVAARSKCGHLFCHVCSIRQRSVSTPSSLIFIWVNQGELEGGRNHFQHKNKQFQRHLINHFSRLLLLNYACSIVCSDQPKSETSISCWSQFLPPSNSP